MVQLWMAGLANVLGEAFGKALPVPLAENVHALRDLQPVQGEAHVLAAAVILQDGLLLQVQGSGLHAVVDGEKGSRQNGGILLAAFLGNGVNQHAQEVVAGFLLVSGDFHRVHAAAAESEAGIQRGVKQGVCIGCGLESADNFKMEGHMAQECGKMKNGAGWPAGSHGEKLADQALCWRRERTSHTLPSHCPGSWRKRSLSIFSPVLMSHRRQVSGEISSASTIWEGSSARRPNSIL